MASTFNQGVELTDINYQPVEIRQVIIYTTNTTNTTNITNITNTIPVTILQQLNNNRINYCYYTYPYHLIDSTITSFLKQLRLLYCFPFKGLKVRATNWYYTITIILCHR